MKEIVASSNADTDDIQTETPSLDQLIVQLEDRRKGIVLGNELYSHLRELVLLSESLKSESDQQQATEKYERLCKMLPVISFNFPIQSSFIGLAKVDFGSLYRSRLINLEQLLVILAQAAAVKLLGEWESLGVVWQNASGTVSQFRVQLADVNISPDFLLISSPAEEFS